MDIILDSGAFSAWTRGVTIDRSAYADFILAKLGYYKYFVNLDCIPSVPGDPNLTFDKLEAAAAIGWDNLEYLLSRQVPKDRLIPVFHQGESFDWLEKMRDSNFPYVGLSPRQDRTTSEKIEWLRECMYYVTDSNGLPYMKLHGFGATSFHIIPLVPWYSVDSISYALWGGYGRLLVPQSRGGSYDFSSPPIITKVTNSTHTLAGLDEDKLLFYTSSGRKYVEEYLRTINIHIGESSFRTESPTYKPDKGKGEVIHKNHADNSTILVETRHILGVTNHSESRAIANAICYALYENHQPIWPYPYKKTTMSFGLSHTTSRSSRKSNIIGVGEPVRIYYASTINKMNEVRAKMMKVTGRDQYRQLVSYHYSSSCRAIEKQYKEWNDGTFDPNDI